MPLSVIFSKEKKPRNALKNQAKTAIFDKRRHSYYTAKNRKSKAESEKIQKTLWNFRFLSMKRYTR
jgi:hypothetical protein